jgi:hypothetical protein
MIDQKLHRHQHTIEVERVCLGHPQILVRHVVGQCTLPTQRPDNGLL